MATELLGHGNATTLLSVHPGPRRNGRTREVRAGSSLPQEVLRMGVGCGGLDRVAGGETVSPRHPGSSLFLNYQFISTR